MAEPLSEAWFSSLDNCKEIIIKNEAGIPITLGDEAEKVHFGNQVRYRLPGWTRSCQWHGTDAEKVQTLILYTECTGAHGKGEEILARRLGNCSFS